MLANTCLADNLSTLSTFNWGKLQLLNVDFFVYIILIHKVIHIFMSKSCESLYFLTFVRFSQNEVFLELFFIHIIHTFENP